MAETIETIDQYVQHLANTLDTCYYDFVDLDTPKDVSDYSRTRSLLFPTSTYAARLWQPGDDIHLMLMSSNSARVFWDMAFEKLDLGDTAPRPKNAQIQLPTDQQYQSILGSAHLGGAKFYLHYCLCPSSFDIDLIQHYGVPAGSYGASSVPSYDQNLQKAHASWKLSRERSECESDHFEPSYLKTRSWAIATGIFSKSLGLLDSDLLLKSVWNSFREWNTKSDTPQASFLHYYFFNQDWDSKLSQDIKIAAPQGIQAIKDEFSLVKASSNIDAAINITPDEGFKRFTSDQTSKFLKLEASCWAQGRTKKEAFANSLHPMLTELVTKSSWLTRIWPWPITAREDSQCEVWTYIISVRQTEPTETVDSEDGKVDDHMKSLNSGLRFDSTSSYVSVAQISGDDLLSLPSPQIPFDLATIQADRGVGRGVKADSPSTGKFRTASSAISRLRFDPVHADVEYEVGYIDRFEGLMFMSLNSWGQKATEEEDFIPMHRVQLLRRQGDHVVVWDREARVDLTSGVV